MPQFNPAVWMPQLVWLGIIFVVLYLLMARVALPRVSSVLEEREARISESLRKAERLRASAEDAIATYEKTMADVRAKAAEEVRTARDQAAAESAKRNAELSERLAAAVSAAEERIHQAKAAAVAGLGDLAGGVAGAAVERLIGKKIEPAAVASAVDKVLSEQRR
jgi:F-type H+-transporting ATPase subunit b